jgi:hypothetical protein
LEVVTNDYSLKPQKNPRISPPKSRGNPRHFRKISGNSGKSRKVAPENRSFWSWIHVITAGKHGKTPEFFPQNPEKIPEIPEISGISEIPGYFKKYVDRVICHLS